jgi:hypothetical protein
MFSLFDSEDAAAIRGTLSLGEDEQLAFTYEDPRRDSIRSLGPAAREAEPLRYRVQKDAPPATSATDASLKAEGEVPQNPVPINPPVKLSGSLQRKTSRRFRAEPSETD